MATAFDEDGDLDEHLLWDKLDSPNYIMCWGLLPYVV